MQIKINFEKRHFWMILSLVLVLSIAVIVYAATGTWGTGPNAVTYTEYSPSKNPGHVDTSIDVPWGATTYVNLADILAMMWYNISDLYSRGGSGTAGVTTFNGRAGAVTLTQSDITATGFTGGTAAGTPIQLYRCPYETTCSGTAVGGSWISIGCVGQLSMQSTCRNLWWNGGPGQCDNTCTSAGTGVISGTTYTQGTGISIVGNVISTTQTIPQGTMCGLRGFFIDWGSSIPVGIYDNFENMVVANIPCKGSTLTASFDVFPGPSIGPITVYGCPQGFTGIINRLNLAQGYLMCVAN